MSKRGRLIVISGPSGVGKGTICREVIARNEKIALSVSATERPPREGELQGVHYYFISAGEFDKMIEKDELLEWAQYGWHRYGTPLFAVEKQLSEGKSVILEIDIQGGLQIKTKHPDAKLIFIVPPSFEKLSERLATRGTETGEQIQKRLSIAMEEMEYKEKYDEIVVNDDLETAVSDVERIINSEE